MGKALLHSLSPSRGFPSVEVNFQGLQIPFADIFVGQLRSACGVLLVYSVHNKRVSIKWTSTVGFNYYLKMCVPKGYLFCSLAKILNQNWNVDF